MMALTAVNKKPESGRQPAAHICCAAQQLPQHAPFAVFLYISDNFCFNGNASGLTASPM
jgi:hypothetical protein